MLLPVAEAGRSNDDPEMFPPYPVDFKSHIIGLTQNGVCLRDWSRRALVVRLRVSPLVGVNYSGERS